MDDKPDASHLDAALDDKKNIEDVKAIRERLTEKLAAARRQKLILYASFIEIFSYLMIGASFAVRNTLLFRPVEPILLLTSPEILVAFAAVFVGGFSFLLNGSTPIVRLVTGKETFDAFSSRFDSIQYTKPEGDERAAENKPVVAIPGQMPPATTRDRAEDTFSTYLQRSADATRIAQRRPNALLWVGTIIAALGLLFFVLTLPGSRYGILIQDDAMAKVTSQDVWATTLQLLPRLLMLIFIQVLAGFFLRQYRTSMEDFRYYEAVLRHREAQYLSYTLRKEMNDKEALKNFAEELLKVQNFGQLAAGHSTTVLEASKNEHNEFSSTLEILSDLVSKAKKAATSKKTSSKKKGVTPKI